MKKQIYLISVLCLIISTSTFAGIIVGWGKNVSGPVPEGNDFVDIACGYYHNLALRTDGTIAAWGSNFYGQCDVPELDIEETYIDIACGKYHSLALTSNGRLVTWGRNRYGACEAPEGNEFTAIACGYYHNLAIREDGSLAAWGWGFYGQCDVPEGYDFVDISAGWACSLALKADGSLVQFGKDNGPSYDPPESNDFTYVACGYFHDLAIREDGSLTAWGWDNYHRLDVPEGEFVDIALGKYHSVALNSNGTLVAWGRNTDGQCKVPEGHYYFAVESNFNHSLALMYTDCREAGWDFKDDRCQFLELAYMGGMEDPPVIPEGFHALGSYYSDSPAGCRFAVKELWPGALAKPVDYVYVNPLEGIFEIFFNSLFGKPWKPVPPPGYVSLGVVLKSKKPGLDEVRCVREDIVVPGRLIEWSELNTDPDESEPFEQVLYHVVPADSNGVYVGTFACPSSEPPYVLDSRVIQQVEYLTLEDVDQLIQNHGPILKTHPDDPYFPDDPEWVLDNGVSLVWGLVENYGDYDKFTITDSNSMLTFSATLMEDVNDVLTNIKPNSPYDNSDLFKYWLNIPDELMFGDLPKAKVMVRILPWNHFFTEVQFWFFYPFNGPGRIRICLSSNFCKSFHITTNGRHYGDWEHITLRFLNSSQSLDAVYMSAHRGGHWYGAADFGKTLQFEGEHPIVYSAKYSHAHYPTVGTHYYERVSSYDWGLGTFSVDLFDLTANGLEFRTYLPDKYRIASYDVYEVTAPDWLGFPARWGQYEKLSITFSIDYLFDTYEYTFSEVSAGPTGPPIKPPWTIGDSGEALGY